MTYARMFKYLTEGIRTYYSRQVYQLLWLRTKQLPFETGQRGTISCSNQTEYVDFKSEAVIIYVFAYYVKWITSTQYTYGNVENQMWSLNK